MKTYLIGYDLNSPSKDYASLFEAIKALANGWWHHLDSTWIIRHAGGAKEIRDSLAVHIDTTDELLVAQLSGEAAWKGFNQKGSAWLKETL